MWPGCHAPCSKLARVETIWVMVTDSTEDSGSACLSHRIPRTASYRLLADGLSQHGCRQVCDDHLAGKDRHNNGHEMTPGGLPASLPGRPTDRLERGQDLAGAGLVVGGARGFPLSAAGSTSMTWYGVSSDLSSTTGMVLGTNLG